MSHHRLLWKIAPVKRLNLFNTKKIDQTFNQKLTSKAETAYLEYKSRRSGVCFPQSNTGNEQQRLQQLSTKKSTRRRRTSSQQRRHHRQVEPSQTTNMTSSSSSILGNVTDNDRFFEHQKTMGYNSILSPLTLKRLEDILIDESIMYLTELIDGDCYEYSGGSFFKNDDMTNGNNGENNNVGRGYAIELLNTGILSVNVWAAVQLGEGAYHGDHVHEDSVLSGVYYSSVPPMSAPLVLRRPSSIGGAGNIGLDTSTNADFIYREDENGDVILSPSEGELVLFPPWVIHGVPPASVNVNEKIVGKKEKEFKSRISYAFNVTGAYRGDPWAVTRR